MHGSKAIAHRPLVLQILEGNTTLVRVFRAMVAAGKQPILKFTYALTGGSVSVNFAHKAAPEADQREDPPKSPPDRPDRPLNEAGPRKQGACYVDAHVEPGQPDV
jgi:hypothetical protein